MAVDFLFNDGGRQEQGFGPSSGWDCVTRSIAIVTGQPYKEVYSRLEYLCQFERVKNEQQSHPETGVRVNIATAYLEPLGYKFTPIKQPLHLDDLNNTPEKAIVYLEGHFTALIGSTVHDTVHPEAWKRDRKIKGYYYKESEVKK